MKIREIMSRNVRCVPPEASLRTAAQTMKDLDVGVLPVCVDDRIGGMVTDRDIVVRAVADGRDLDRLTVRDVMTAGVSWCQEDDDVKVATELMQSKQIRRVVVLDKDKRMVGIVSLGDVSLRSQDDKLSGRTLEAVSEPVHP